MRTQYRLRWTMWSHECPVPRTGEAIHDDEDRARRQHEGLLSMIAPHELRPCSDHVWDVTFERRTVERGGWQLEVEAEG